MNTAYESVIPFFIQRIHFILSNLFYSCLEVNEYSKKYLHKIRDTEDSLDRKNCGIISHSVAERRLNLSRSM